MKSISQTSPLLNSAHFAQHSNAGEDYHSSPSDHQIDNQQQLNRNQGHSQVDAFREVEQRAQQSQDAIVCNDNQVTHQIVDLVANNADISRCIIEKAKQEICNQQYNIPLGRQKYQQLLEQLAQINELLRHHLQFRANTQNALQRKNFAEQLVGLARQAQHLARVIINHTMSRRDDSIVKTPFYPKSYTGHRHANLGQYNQNQGFYANFQ